MATKIEKILANILMNLNRIKPKLWGVSNVSWAVGEAKKACIGRDVKKAIKHLPTIISVLSSVDDYSSNKDVRKAVRRLKKLENQVKEYSLSHFLLDKKEFIVDTLDDVVDFLKKILTRSTIFEDYIVVFLDEYNKQTKKMLSAVPNLSQKQELNLIKSFSILAEEIQNVNDEYLAMNDPDTDEQQLVKDEIEKLIGQAVSDWNRIMVLIHYKLEMVFSLKHGAVAAHSKSQGVEGIRIKD